MPSNISPSDALGSMRVPRIALLAHGYSVSVGSGLRAVLSTPGALEGFCSPGRRLSMATWGRLPGAPPISGGRLGLLSVRGAEDLSSPQPSFSPFFFSSFLFSNSFSHTSSHRHSTTTQRNPSKSGSIFDAYS